MEYTLIEIIKVAAPLLAIGGAWGGAKVALNGTRERVKAVDTKLNAHIEKHTEQQMVLVDRTARIETKLDSLLENK